MVDSFLRRLLRWDDTFLDTRWKTAARLYNATMPPQVCLISEA